MSDTNDVVHQMPVFHYETEEEFFNSLPLDCRVVGVEKVEGSKNLKEFCHFPQAVYILGAEDYGLPESIIKKCNAVIEIPTKYCINVAAAGSIVLYDRLVKNG